MATVLIQNGAVCGAFGAVMAGRDGPPSDGQLEAAEAVVTEILAVNAALDTPMADADNAQIGQLLQAVTYAAMVGRNFTSITAADYAAIAATIVDICVRGKTALTS